MGTTHVKGKAMVGRLYNGIGLVRKSYALSLRRFETRGLN